MADPLAPEATSLKLGGLSFGARREDVFAGLFWLSIACFLVSSLIDLGPFSVLFSIAGTATCGFSWLFARAMFSRPQSQEIWPLVVVGALVVTGAALHLFWRARTGDDGVGGALRMAASIHNMLSSTVLLLALVETFRGFSPDLPTRERRFRLVFAAGYASLMGVSVIWLRAVAEGSWADQSGDAIRTICAALAVAMSVAAWAYRRKNPLPKQKRRPRLGHTPSAEEAELGQRLTAKLEQDAIYLEPDLKLSDLARKLGEPDYKISQCVTGALGFRNFNHLVNHYRIAAAKRMLSDASLQDQSILSVALDSGFSSIGPFNRAFKAETGVTPGAFRASFSDNHGEAQPA